MVGVFLPLVDSTWTLIQNLKVALCIYSLQCLDRVIAYQLSDIASGHALPELCE